jgi:hypothetical protein
VCGGHVGIIDVRAPIGMMYNHADAQMDIVYCMPNCHVPVLPEPQSDLK